MSEGCGGAVGDAGRVPGCAQPGPHFHEWGWAGREGELELEGVAPAEAGEAAEVGVVGVEFGLVFDGEGGDVGVGGQVACDASGFEG